MVDGDRRARLNESSKGRPVCGDVATSGHVSGASFVLKKLSGNNFPFSAARDSVESVWSGILYGEAVIVFGSMS